MATTYDIAHLVPKKSATAGKSIASDYTKFVQGEIGVNTADEKIFVKTSDNTQAVFSSDSVRKKENDATYLALSGGTVSGVTTFTKEVNVSGVTTFNDKVNMPYMGKMEAIQDVISGNAYVTSAALNDLNTNKADKTDVVMKNELYTTLYPKYTLEQTSNPEFKISNKDNVVFQAYTDAMGGYMLYFGEGKTGKVYAAKLDTQNWNKFADGTEVTSGISSACETMVHVPKCYFRASGQTMTFGGLTDIGGQSFNSPEWVGAYLMQVDSNSVGHSRPDVSPSHSMTMSTFWNCAQNLHQNAGLMNYDFYCLINTLYQVGWGNLNSQKTIGANVTNGSYWATWRDVAMGRTRTLGDGTGSIANSDASTVGVDSCVKLLGFEDLWTKLWQFLPGIRFYMSGGTRYALVYSGNVVSNTITEGRSFSYPIQSASGSFVNKMRLGEYWDMLPIAINGSDSTYYCDATWADTAGELLFSGGHGYDGSRCGLSVTDSYNAFSFSWAGDGARLAFYGGVSIISGSELAAKVGA